MEISELTTDIRFLASKVNQVADTLSRAPAPTRPAAPSPSPAVAEEESLHSFFNFLSATSASVASANLAPEPTHSFLEAPAADLPTLAQAQQEDQSLQQYLLKPEHSIKFQTWTMHGSQLTIIMDVSKQKPRPLVPQPLRKKITLQLYGFNHPGIKATVKLVGERFYWPDMDRQIRGWTRACLRCQRAKVLQHIHTPTQPIPIPTRRFSHIHVDCVGTLPTSMECSSLFTIVDRTTRYMEAVPIKDTLAQHSSGLSSTTGSPGSVSQP